jgi:SOS response regulatory protein OraA/RecX
MSKPCKTGLKSCVYHACMSNRCQRHHVSKANQKNFGAGECDKKVAQEMIDMMTEAGLSPDDMIRVIHLAREKFNQRKKQNTTKLK